jgi:hypothetical protein
MRWICLMFCALLIAGCAHSSPAATGNATEPLDDVIAPTNTFVPSATPSPQPEVIITETPSASAPCAWMWAEQPLPEVSIDLTRALQEAGLDGVVASASAFGENCVTGPDNDYKIDHFASMQTDFHLTIHVEKLADKQELGGWIERVMPVIESIPAESLKGPNPGQVSIRFTSGENEVNMQFSRARGKSLMEEGKTGSALYDALHVP